MEFHSDLKADLLEAAKKSEIALNHCIPEYEPQKRRLHVWNLANIGDDLYHQGRYNDALVYYKKAKIYDCDEPSILNQIGVCYVKLGRVERALQYFDELYRRASSTTDKALALYNTSCCHQITQGFNDAILALKKSLKFDFKETVAQELELLKERNSSKAFMKFKLGLFHKDVLPKEERLGSQQTQDTPSVTAQEPVSNATMQYKDRMKTFRPVTIEEDISNSTSLKAGA